MPVSLFPCYLTSLFPSFLVASFDSEDDFKILGASTAPAGALCCLCSPMNRDANCHQKWPDWAECEGRVLIGRGNLSALSPVSPLIRPFFFPLSSFVLDTSIPIHQHTPHTTKDKQTTWTGTWDPLPWRGSWLSTESWLSMPPKASLQVLHGAGDYLFGHHSTIPQEFRIRIRPIL